MFSYQSLKIMTLLITIVLTSILFLAPHLVAFSRASFLAFCEFFSFFAIAYKLMPIWRTSSRSLGRNCYEKADVIEFDFLALILEQIYADEWVSDVSIEIRHGHWREICQGAHFSKSSFHCKKVQIKEKEEGSNMFWPIATLKISQFSHRLMKDQVESAVHYSCEWYSNQA